MVYGELTGFSGWFPY